MLKLFFAAKPNNWSRPIRFWLVALVVLTSIFGQAAASAAPVKTRSSDGDATVYVWWLVRWENNQVACSLSVAHDGPPTANEIELGCGTGLLYQWQATPYCADSSASCTGLYLHLATRIQQRTNLRETVYTRPSWVSTASSVGAMELLSYSVDPETLASSRSLLYLAGRMIKNGMIAADDCPGGGLLPSGAANRCGEARAQETVVEWQNQFDEAIIQAAEQTQVPPRLLKNLFVQESQLWPGIEYSLSSSDEFGLGHMTEAGADTLLTWNTAYFKSLCTQMLGDDACESGYVFMPAGQRAILRGIVLRQVGAECRTCPWGVDLRQAQKVCRFSRMCWWLMRNKPDRLSIT